MNTEKSIPEGYMQDARGALWPVQSIKEIDRTRDELVREIVAKVKAENVRLARLKAEVFGDIEAFVALSGEKYGVAMGGKKGNVSLLSFDGRYKLQRAIADRIELRRTVAMRHHQQANQYRRQKYAQQV